MTKAEILTAIDGVANNTVAYTRDPLSNVKLSMTWVGGRAQKIQMPASQAWIVLCLISDGILGNCAPSPTTTAAQLLAQQLLRLEVVSIGAHPHSPSVITGRIVGSSPELAPAYFKGNTRNDMAASVMGLIEQVATAWGNLVILSHVTEALEDIDAFHTSGVAVDRSVEPRIPEKIPERRLQLQLLGLLREIAVDLP